MEIFIQDQYPGFLSGSQNIHNLFQSFAIIVCNLLYSDSIRSKSYSTVIQPCANFFFQIGFHEMRATCCSEKETYNSNENITADQFAVNRFSHSLFTSNLYPIPQTVEIDQFG